MPTAEQTLDEILSLAAAHFKVPREKLAPDDDFFKTLGIDSLQTLDLLTKLENHFRVELPDYELQGISDFRTLAGRIQARDSSVPIADCCWLIDDWNGIARVVNQQSPIYNQQFFYARSPKI